MQQKDSNQVKSLEHDMVVEQAKQIVLDFYYSFYMEKDFKCVLKNIAKDIQWLGWKNHCVAHNRDDFEQVVKEELQTIPDGCEIRVEYIDANFLTTDCIAVNGILEIRMPYDSGITYIVCKISANIIQKNNVLSIATLHSSVDEENKHMDSAKFEELLGSVTTEEESKAEQHDFLTGLYNIDAFKEVVDRHLKQDGPDKKYALLYTDIINFEKVNNLYGFQKGDEILIEFAKLATSFTPAVICTSRGASDHFIIFVELETENKLKREIVDLSNDFNETITSNYHEAKLSLGVGVYVIRDNKKNVNQMVEKANIARKSIPISTGGIFSFYDARSVMKVEKMREIEKHMHEALNNGEFKVFLQPKFELSKINVVGAEALIRWIRPDGTKIYPDEFIPLFEKNGFIHHIDFYVLEVVCDLIHKRILNNQYCFPISVNQSRYLLKDKDYVNRVKDILTRYEIPPHLIELELTERLFADRLQEMAQIMRQLKEFGVIWSIDDFGTGYSSLNLLKELPVDIIKIDKTFLDETEDSETSRIIIRKTVELTRELHKKVICEGVETREQEKYLKEIQCDMAQGYLYAKPMPIEEFEQLVKDY